MLISPALDSTKTYTCHPESPPVTCIPRPHFLAHPTEPTHMTPIIIHLATPHQLSTLQQLLRFLTPSELWPAAISTNNSRHNPQHPVEAGWTQQPNPVDLIEKIQKYPPKIYPPKKSNARGFIGRTGDLSCTTLSLDCSFCLSSLGSINSSSISSF